MWRIRHRHLIERLFLSQKLRHGKIRPLFVFEKEPCNIQPGQIDSVVNPVVIWVAKIAVVPGFETATEYQIQFKMDMGPRLIQSFPAVTHARDPFRAIHPLTRITTGFTTESI